MLREIQYLRAIAVLMVVWMHAGFLQQATGQTLRMIGLGFIVDAPGMWGYFAAIAGPGVDIFFVISGYVVSASLWRSLALDPSASFLPNLENNIHNLKAFFVKRFFRLVPIAVLLIILQTPGIWLSPSWFSSTNITEQFMALLSYFSLQNDIDTITFSDTTQHYRMTNHYWSLAVEERFYLIIPFVILACATPRRFMLVAMCTIFGLAVLKALYPFSVSHMYLNGFLRFDSFMFGILVFLLEKHTKVFKRLFTGDYNRILMNAISIVLLIIIARLPVVQVNGDKMEDILKYKELYFYYPSVYLFSAILIALASQDKGYVLEIPYLNKILHWIGDRSYCIYVMQFWYMFIAHKLMESITLPYGREAATSVLYFVVTGVLTELIYRYFENPLRQYGRNLAKKIKEKGELLLQTT